MAFLLRMAKQRTRQATTTTARDRRQRGSRHFVTIRARAVRPRGSTTAVPLLTRAPMGWLDFVRTHLLALPLLTKFVLLLAVVVGVPALSRRLRLPAAVGLLLSGLVLGPHGLDVFGDRR